jgi:hypothetical protein
MTSDRVKCWPCFIASMVVIPAAVGLLAWLVIR